ncbi:hypothetical protein, partial [Oryzibacter oryziterrae]|uniref:hypothetical protein n=1 Tax=Oryzibacter oryziterrae TaxID=2766474 RepID=UPI001F1D5610
TTSRTDRACGTDLHPATHPRNFLVPFAVQVDGISAFKMNKSPARPAAKLHPLTPIPAYKIVTGQNK